MMFLRNTSSRCVRQLRLRQAARRNPLPGQTSRRGYANASDAANKAKEGAEKAKHGAQSMLRGELPWALGATLVTVPTTYMILANGSHGEDAGYPGDKYHGSEGHDEEEHEEEEGGGEGEQDEAEAGEKDEGGDEKDGGEEEKTEGNDEPEKGESQTEHEVNKADEDKSKDGGDRSNLGNPSKDGESDDAGEGKKEGGDEKQEGGDDKPQDGEKSEGGDEQPEGKNSQYADSSRGGEIKRSEGKNVSEQPMKNELSKKTKSGESAKWTDTVELENEGSDSKKIHKPDAKGGAKRRIESSYGNKLGHADGDVPDSHATSGQEAKEGSITKKTVGLSNTETKHSIDIANDPEKSKKGDGTPETAKSMGTIDARKSSVR